METQERENAVQGRTIDKDKYIIFGYFREHTAFFIACVSAAVAVMSFIINYAVGCYNYAYLNYWSIDGIHAISNNQNQLYTVVCAFLNCLSLLAIHGLLSGTSDAFRQYNQLLSILNRQIKNAKATRKELRMLEKKVNKNHKEMHPEEIEGDEVRKIKDKIKKAKTDQVHVLEAVKNSENARKDLKKWVRFNVFISILFSYIIGILFVLLMKTAVTFKEFISATIMVIGIIVFDLFIYFLPAYFSSRCTKAKYEKLDVVDYVKNMIDREMRQFPIEEIVKNGLKSMISDKKLKLAIGQFITVAVILLYTMSLNGAYGAKTKCNFPIFSDATGDYAVVYNTGERVFMEFADIKDDTIVIDTNKQRVIAIDDFSYEIRSFREVSKVGIDGVQTSKKKTATVDDIYGKVKSFLTAPGNELGGDS